MSEPRAQEGSVSAEAKLDQLIAGISRVLDGQDDVAFAYLFGSFAKGTAGADSDVDLGVVFRPEERLAGGRSRAERGLRLGAELEEALGRTVQVVDLESAAPGLVQNVLHTGRLICRPDRAVHAGFYVAHANRYFDMAPARAIFDRYRSRRIEEGDFGGREGNRP
jgi:predicted nucleotidyltransferase